MLGFDFVFGAALFNHVCTEPRPCRTAPMGSRSCSNCPKPSTKSTLLDSESANTSAGADGWPVGVVCHVSVVVVELRDLVGL
jgi:hypothetical protein